MKITNDKLSSICQRYKWLKGNHEYEILLEKNSKGATLDTLALIIYIYASKEWRESDILEILKMELNRKTNRYKIVPNKRLPKSFHEAVRHLCRPYIPITKEQFDEILSETKKQNSDFITDGQKIYTFGAADGGYALMPYREYI